MDFTEQEKVTCLGKTFENEEERREYFREELRKKLPELKRMDGFPNGEDEDILKLSDPPYYTACPNPWLDEVIEEWENEKKELEEEGKRRTTFKVGTPFTGDVSVGKNNAVYRAHSYHTKVPHPAIMRYIMHYTQPGDIIYDGFAGTGMTGVAASLCENPEKKVKQEIENKFRELGLEKPDWGKRHSICNDLSPIASFISSIYNSKSDIRDKISEAQNTIANAKERFKDYYQTKHTESGVNGKINYVIWSEIFLCPNCNEEFSYWDSAVKLDENKILKKFPCPNCNAKLKKRDVDLKKKTIFDESLGESRKVAEFKPVLINYSVNNNRFEKKPDSDDLELIEKVQSLKTEKVADHSIFEGDEIGRLSKHGINNIRELYFNRARVIYDELLEQADRELLFVLTSAAQNNSKLYRFRLSGKGGTTSGTYYICSTPQENNVFNSIKYKFRDIKKAARICSEGYALTSTGSATDVNIADNSVDYIFTDPPFGSNLMYSELNLLYETWLNVTTNNNKEAISSNYQNKGITKYNALINSCFEEYYRILKPGKWMTVEFSNTSAEVWNGIQTSIQNAGFIIANVASIDKKQGSFKAVTTPTAVKQDLVISCYKPSDDFKDKFKDGSSSISVWDFMNEHLKHLPIHLREEGNTTAIIERTPKILYDRLVSFYVTRGLPVPIDSQDFQEGLKKRYADRNGMFFTQDQVVEYDEKKSKTSEFIQLSLNVANESEGIEWLRAELKDKPQAYQDLQPKWMKAITAVRKGDVLPELQTILDQNFIKREDGKWRVPNMSEAKDREAMRNKALLRQFEEYVDQVTGQGAKKLKEARAEALRAGFKNCWDNKDFKTIVQVGEKIPENLLLEDDQLLMYYDIASDRI